MMSQVGVLWEEVLKPHNTITAYLHRGTDRQIGTPARFVTCRTNGFHIPTSHVRWKHGLIMAINSALSI